MLTTHSTPVFVVAHPHDIDSMLTTHSTPVFVVATSGGEGGGAGATTADCCGEGRGDVVVGS